MIQQEKTLLILNPKAGKGKGKKNFQAIFSSLNKIIKNLDTAISEYPGHIFKFGEMALLEKYRQIITIGGDGTPFEVINGIYSRGKPEQNIRLGMIPAGTGNSFLRDFMDISYENALRNISNNKKKKVDLIEINYFKGGKEQKQYYLNILGIGLIADILKLTNEKLKPFGPLSYHLAVLMRLFKGMNNKMVLKVDDKKVELNNSALVISNSKYTGGNMKIAPMAETDDGKVDAVIFNEVNRRDIINIFINVFKGEHINHKKVKVFSGREISIEAEPKQLLMADGELLGETPLRLRVHPKEIEIIL